MMKWARDFRLIPVLLIATVSLFALKVSGLWFDGGYTLGDRLRDRNENKLTITSPDSIPDVTPIKREDPQLPAEAVRTSAPQASGQKSWAQEMFNYGGPIVRDNNRDRDIITGSVASKPADAPPPKPDKKAEAPPKKPDGLVVNTEADKLPPKGERAILERLQDRREDLDTRAKEIEMRENLLKAAEKRVEARIGELKTLETRVNAAVETRDKAEQERFKNIVTMYETMKPKEAARIFDKLDLRVLIEVSTQMNPRKMSEVLAQMSPDAAQLLTVEFARRAAADKSQGADALPKIDGRPSGS